MTNTMTYAQALTFAIENLTNTEVTDRLTALKAQVEKRSTSDRKPTKKQIENECLKTDILKQFYSGNRYRSGEIAKVFNISNQKASALLNQLVDDGLLDKIIEKKITYFTAEDTTETSEATETIEATENEGEGE